MPERVVIAIGQKRPDSQRESVVTAIANDHGLAPRNKIDLAFEHDAVKVVAPGGAGIIVKVFEQFPALVHEFARILAAVKRDRTALYNRLFFQARKQHITFGRRS
jgi:hypothetical protein